MSNAVVASLRSRGQVIRLDAAGGPAIRVRVEMPEVWDVVGFESSSSESVLALKVAALDALFPQAAMHEDFVLKLRGWEILDESASWGDAGIVDGSTLLLTHRRRRAVR